MTYRILISDETETDVEESCFWYAVQRIGLEIEFYEDVKDSILQLARNPFICQVIYKNIRRFIMHKFPYGVYYIIDDDLKEIKVIGVIHFKRSQKIWKKRI